MSLKHITTKADYQAYVAKVESFIEGNKVKAGCYGAKEPDGEAFFSSTPCGCCGRSLGGNRETYSFVSQLGDFEEDICVDCIYFLAYGILDDMTMMEIDKLENTP